MANTYTLIASNVLSSAAATIDFTSIPNTYTDLVIRLTTRSDLAANTNNLRFRINGDTATNYSNTELAASNGSAYSSRGSSQTFFLGYTNAASTTSNTFTSSEFYIPNYLVSANKPFGFYQAVENNGTYNELGVFAGLWRNTAAITSLSIYFTSGNFVAGSSFYLYGISKN